MVTSRGKTWTPLDKQKGSQCPTVYLEHLGRIMVVYKKNAYNDNDDNLYNVHNDANVYKKIKKDCSGW